MTTSRKENIYMQDVKRCLEKEIKDNRKALSNFKDALKKGGRRNV